MFNRLKSCQMTLESSIAMWSPIVRQSPAVRNDLLIWFPKRCDIYIDSSILVLNTTLVIRLVNHLSCRNLECKQIILSNFKDFWSTVGPKIWKPDLSPGKAIEKPYKTFSVLQTRNFVYRSSEESSYSKIFNNLAFYWTKVLSPGHFNNNNRFKAKNTEWF